MSESEPKTEETLRRLSEVLDVLKRISEDLQDISRSLRAASPTQAQAPRVVPAPAADQPVRRGIEDIRMMFEKELEELLIFEDKDDYIKVTPRQYLGSDNFAKIASTIREAGGEYISAGRDSHFRIPK